MLLNALINSVFKLLLLVGTRQFGELVLQLPHLLSQAC